jgi:hypothetical protein
LNKKRYILWQKDGFFDRVFTLEAFSLKFFEERSGSLSPVCPRPSLSYQKGYGVRCQKDKLVWKGPVSFQKNHNENISFMKSEKSL